MAEARLDEDPLLDIEIGEGGPFEISDDPCGARTITSLNEWNVVTCDRDPHPQAWLHVSICDDEVEHVWRDITPEELKLIVVSDEGVTFACCGWLLSLNSSHEDNCKVGGRDRQSRPAGVLGVDEPFREVPLHMRVDLPAGLGRLSETRRIEVNTVVPLETDDCRVAAADLEEKLDEAGRAVLLQFHRLTSEGGENREPEGSAEA